MVLFCWSTDRQVDAQREAKFEATEEGKRAKEAREARKKKAQEEIDKLSGAAKADMPTPMKIVKQQPRSHPRKSLGPNFSVGRIVNGLPNTLFAMMALVTTDRAVIVVSTA